MTNNKIKELQDVFNELKKYVNFDKYQIVNYISEDFKMIENQKYENYFESKLVNRLKSYMQNNKILDKEKNEIIEDEVLCNKILFANLWYIINCNYDSDQNNNYNIETTFNSKSFLNYFFLIEIILYLKKDNKYTLNNLYTIASKNNKFLYYFLKELFFNNKITLKDNVKLNQNLVIFKSLEIFETYIENNFIFNNEKKIK